ncbi:MAG: hypothetical protein CR984_06595 [Proteobacteria bacterium]|nr:MAG: hypothetical protein CR984_06595 [Pseudomonadota bacterium]
MTDVYEKLAQHLDNLPSGYPRTESGVEMRILKRLFSPQEADIATKLTMLPEPVSGIAQRIERDKTKLADILAEVEAEACIGCEACVDRRQMDAITVDGVAEIELDCCIGYGLCVTDCPTEAMQLKQKAEKDHHIPPKNVFETYLNMAQERGLL